jgi:hypothetical protein
MKKFKEFGIKPASQSMQGDKIKISKVINREIVVHDFKVEDSKFGSGSSKCLYMQISIGETKHVIFTGSTVLIETIQQIPKADFPFITTIVKEDERFEFS